jgi:hypothetical protein
MLFSLKSVSENAHISIGLPHTIPFQQRKVFIDEVAKYFTIIKCKGMLDGLLEGLKYYEVLYTVNMYFMWLQT